MEYRIPFGSSFLGASFFAAGLAASLAASLGASYYSSPPP
jgi:hypothetical protein